jgi:hypothetical protein
MRNFACEVRLTPSESPLAESPRSPYAHTEQQIGRGRLRQGLEAASTQIWSTCVLRSTHALARVFACIKFRVCPDSLQSRG